jgi:hypothetical protein
MAYGVVKRVVIPYEYGLFMTDAMLQYADEHGFTLALTGENGMAGLYWNREGQLVRLAVEEVK